MQTQTKAQLKAQLNALNIAFNSKATHAQLVALVASANTQATRKKRNARRWGLLGSSKHELRKLFAANKRVTYAQVLQIATALKVRNSAVFTALSDLKNAKYASGDVVKHVKIGEGKNAVWELVE